MKPKQSPSLISRLRFDSATSVPYRLVRLTVLMTAAIGTNPLSILTQDTDDRCGFGLSWRGHLALVLAARAAPAAAARAAGARARCPRHRKISLTPLNPLVLPARQRRRFGCRGVVPCGVHGAVIQRADE